MEKFNKSPLNPVLFSYPMYEYMAKELIRNNNLIQGAFTLKRFLNDELYITLDTNVDGIRCIVLGSLAPPDGNLLSFLILCHTLKKEQAVNITAVLPYLAYSRHDKNEPLKSHITALLGEILPRTGINKIITFDIHSPHAQSLFPIPLISLSTAKLFAKEIISQSLGHATIVAPDEGAIDRCEAVLKEADMKGDVAYMIKRRTDQQIIHSELRGEVGTSAIIVDDILDTGKTLVSCCEKLSRVGVKNIYIMITHGLFTGTVWQKLWQLGVRRIYCTNTVPIAPQVKSENIIELSIVPLLSDKLS